VLSLVREDRDGHTACGPVVPPGALLGSDVWEGEPLKASKREARLKMSSPEGGDTLRRFLGDDQVDRLCCGRAVTSGADQS
jgi:hypothetical protein